MSAMHFAPVSAMYVQIYFFYFIILFFILSRCVCVWPEVMAFAMLYPLYVPHFTKCPAHLLALSLSLSSHRSPVVYFLRVKYRGWEKFTKSVEYFSRFTHENRANGHTSMIIIHMWNKHKQSTHTHRHTNTA